MPKVLTSKVMILSWLMVQLIILLLGYHSLASKIWTVDLTKVISSYSQRAAAEGLTNAEISQDFKQRWEEVIQNLPHQVILVDGRHLLFKQTTVDVTELILNQMGLYAPK